MKRIFKWLVALAIIALLIAALRSGEHGAVIIFLGALFLFWLAGVRKKPKKKKEPQAESLSTNYGTARFAAHQEHVTDGLAATRGAFLGKSMEFFKPDLPGAPIFTTPENHTLIVARTRTGKGTRVIVPTLLRYRGSALVIDPKGENAAITARARRHQMGQAVHVVNPWNELTETYARHGHAPATINPLDVIDPHDPNAVAIAQSFAATICAASPDDKDRFWQGSAANLLAAVFLWLADTPMEKKTLGRARQIVTLPRDKLRSEFLIPMMTKDHYGGAIGELVGTLIDLAPETYSGIMANLAEATKFLSDPQIKAATEASSFDLSALVETPTTVYLVIPPDRIETQRPWLRLVIAATMHVFKRARHRGGHRCMFLIDEFASLGRIDDVPRDIATMGGHGVDFMLIVQGVDQIKHHYGQAAAATILGNCGYKWFCNIGDHESAKYLSDTLGQKTVRTVSESDSRNVGAGGPSSGQSTSYGEMGRALMTADEIIALGRDTAIAIQPKGRPHLLKTVDYWVIQDTFKHEGLAHPELYWDPPLKFDANPYHARGRSAAAL